MLQHVSKLCFCFLVLILPLFSQCSQADPKTKATKKETAQVDSSEIIKVTETTIKEEPKKLPNWPLKAKKVKGKRYPFDEGQKYPDFILFRKNLYQAVLNKDLDFLKSIIHEDIKFSFGAENGLADFLNIWQLNSNPQNSELWSKLEMVLSLGGAFFNETEKNFYAPYIFMLNDIEDPYTQAVIIGEKVRLRDRPSTKSNILNSLNWDLVEIVQHNEYYEETINDETHPWIKVKTANGETGFVFGKYVRSPIDFRAGFKKYDGKWMMNSFIAGD